MENLVPILVAVLGAGGFGAFFREIVAGVVKVAGGMSARESKRKVDIVQQRDQALQDFEASEKKRRKAIELAATYRVQLLNAGITPGEDDAWAYVQSTRRATDPPPPTTDKEKS